MTAQQTSARYRSWLVEEGEALAIALDGDPTTAVPTCPGWSMTDLAAHVGSYHQWAADLLRDTSQEARAPYHLRPDPNSALSAWYRSSLRQLLDAVDTTDPSTPMWTVTLDHTAGAWTRRQAHELAIHRWDAQHARGTAEPIVAEHAADFIDELFGAALPYVMPFLGRRLPRTSLALEASDAALYRHVDGATGRIRFTREPSRADTSLVGTASDLVLALWRRPNHASVNGDRANLAAWQDAIDG